MSRPAIKRKRSSWFAFYPEDFASGTRTMTLAARGAFVALLGHQFSTGSVPSDDRTICRILGAFPDEWEEIKEEVLTKFDVLEDGSLVNQRMVKEREEREGIRAKRIEAVQKRWDNASKDDSKADTKEHTSVDTKVDTHVATSTTSTSTPSHSLDKSAAKAATVAPLPFSSAEFQEAWEMWEQHRKEKRAKVTPTARKQQLAKLEALGEAKAIAAIQHSVANGYQGIFEPNESTTGNRKGSGRTTDRNAGTFNDPSEFTKFRELQRARERAAASA